MQTLAHVRLRSTQRSKINTHHTSKRQISGKLSRCTLSLDRSAVTLCAGASCNVAVPADTTNAAVPAHARILVASQSDDDSIACLQKN